MLPRGGCPSNFEEVTLFANVEIVDGRKRAQVACFVAPTSPEGFGTPISLGVEIGGHLGGRVSLFFILIPMIGEFAIEVFTF